MGEDLKTRGYSFRCGFVPTPLEWTRSLATALVRGLDGSVEFSEINYGGRDVTLRQVGSGRTSLTCRFASDGLALDYGFPQVSQSLFVKQIEEALKVVMGHASIQFVVPVAITIRKAMTSPARNANGHPDARVFVGEQVLRLEEGRRSAFGRPIHCVGVRLFFPPYAIPEHGVQASNQVDLKIESLVEDPREVYLEAEWVFLEPRPAAAYGEGQIKGDMDAVEAFMARSVSGFLQGGQEGLHD